jgi:hypothetical protein
MRQYRGIQVDTKEWVYGWYMEMPHIKQDVTDMGSGAVLCEQVNATKISPIIAYLPEHDTGLRTTEVIPESAGQYTGLKDKKRKEIYEGDIVKCGDCIFIVQWGLYNAAYLAKCDDERMSPLLQELYCEIIGTIHTHPELLQKG